MNARERVLAVLNDETPDRMPVDLWLVPELVETMKHHLSVDTELDVYRALGVDKIAWLSIKYTGRPPEPETGQSVPVGRADAGASEPGASEPGATQTGVTKTGASEPGATRPGATGMVYDHWGVGFKTMQANRQTEYQELAYHPLLEMEDPSELENYPWPDPSLFDYQSAVTEAKALAGEFVTLGPWISLFEVYCAMRSLEEALVDTVANPDFLHAALDRIAWSQGKMIERYLQVANGAVDMVFVSDDMGTQQSLLISPEAFEEFIFPRLKRWTDMIHGYGAKVFFHTDGAVDPIIPRLIEAGIDILNPIQHACPGMDRRDLKAKYGENLVFHGGVENQRILPFGSPQEVAEETRQCMEQLGPTGYVPCSCHFAQADTPVQNILAMVDTAKSFTFR